MYWDSATLADDACLTPREIDVLRLIARGCTYQQVADRLGVSLHTVASHTKNTHRKLRRTLGCSRGDAGSRDAVARVTQSFIDSNISRKRPALRLNASSTSGSKCTGMVRSLPTVRISTASSCDMAFLYGRSERRASY